MTPAQSTARRGVWVALALAAAGGGAWLFWPKGPEPKQPAAVGRPPASEFQGVRLQEEDPDGTRWSVSASEGSGWESEGTGKLRGVQATFERRGKRLTVKAGSGEVSDGNTVALSGGVEASWDRYVVRMDRAAYYRGQGVIGSDSLLSVEGPRIRVRGKGLEVDVEGRRARVLSEVRATIGGPST